MSSPETNDVVCVAGGFALRRATLRYCSLLISVEWTRGGLTPPHSSSAALPFKDVAQS